MIPRICEQYKLQRAALHNYLHHVLRSLSYVITMKSIQGTFSEPKYIQQNPLLRCTEVNT